MDDLTPAQATLEWHTAARQRDEARLADGPDDDSEHPESPWR